MAARKPSLTMFKQMLVRKMLVRKMRKPRSIAISNWV